MADPDKPAEHKQAPEPTKLAPLNSELLRGVQVSLEAKLGTATLTVEQMMALKAGSIVNLDTGLGDQVELCLNGSLVARCEIVAVGDKFGVRIVEIAPAP